MKYAQRLSPDAATPIELFEGENDEDEVFWMILGDDDFAKADYWRWRHNCVEPDPMIWRSERRNAMPVRSLSLLVTSRFTFRSGRPDRVHINGPKRS
jgi:hypothetical protein